MLLDERKGPYRSRIPVIWDEIDEIKRELMKLKNIINGGLKQCLYSTQTFLNNICLKLTICNMKKLW